MTFQAEQLKAIPGTDRYYCDKLGNIYTDGPVGNSSYRGPIRIKKPYKKSNGYLTVKLVIFDRQKNFYVHRLVLQTWTEIAGDGLDCNHIDGNKANNRFENLEWATRKENMQHCTGVLGKRNRKGDLAYFKKLSSADVVEIRRLRQVENWTFARIAEQFRMNESWIYRVATRKAWDHVA